MIESEVKLTKAQKAIMLEAARRYLEYYFDQPIEDALAGLGTVSSYKCVQTAGLMKLLDSASPHGIAGWWTLTPKGAKIVREIIRKCALIQFDKELSIIELYETNILDYKKLVSKYTNSINICDSKIGKSKYYFNSDLSEISHTLSCYEIHKLLMKNNIIPKETEWDHEHSCCYYYFPTKKIINKFVRNLAAFVHKRNNSIDE